MKDKQPIKYGRRMPHSSSNYVCLLYTSDAADE